jgi:CheY-like chemotaxis protein
MSQTPTVLYVEDEADDVFFMRQAFKRAGLAEEFRSVDDGRKAIAYLDGLTPYDDRSTAPLPALVLLDLNLPIYSGFEVLQWLRQQPQYRDLTVVTFSSSGRDEDRERARQLGATDYLLKPSSGLQFVEIVKLLKERWLKNSAPPPPPGPAGLSNDTLQGAN